MGPGYQGDRQERQDLRMAGQHKGDLPAQELTQATLKISSPRRKPGPNKLVQSRKYRSSGNASMDPGFRRDDEWWEWPLVDFRVCDCPGLPQGRLFPRLE